MLVLLCWFVGAGTTRPNEKWYVTVLSSAYSRSALDYKIRIKGTAPSASVSPPVGDCTRLSWEYATCSGGQGTCSVDQVRRGTGRYREEQGFAVMVGGEGWG